MTVKSECFAKGHRLLRFYQYLDEIKDDLNRVPTAPRPNAIIGAIKQVDIDLAKGEVENLFRTGTINEITYHGFRTRLKDIGEALPDRIIPELPESKIEELLDRSRKELDIFQFNLEDILYQEVAKCEFGR